MDRSADSVASDDVGEVRWILWCANTCMAVGLGLWSLFAGFRLLYLIFIRVVGRLILLGRSNASKDVEILVLSTR